MSEKNKSIQEKMVELSELVAWFQGDDFTLEGAVEVYGKAEALAEDIESDLTKVKNDIAIIKDKFES